jgi:hypothetical protein
MPSSRSANLKGVSWGVFHGGWASNRGRHGHQQPPPLAPLPPGAPPPAPAGAGRIIFGAGVLGSNMQEFLLVGRHLAHDLAHHGAEHLAHQAGVHGADVDLAVVLLVDRNLAGHEDGQETHRVFLEDGLGILGAARLDHQHRQHVAAVGLHRLGRIAQTGGTSAQPLPGVLDVVLDAGDGFFHAERALTPFGEHQSPALRLYPASSSSRSVPAPRPGCFPASRAIPLPRAGRRASAARARAPPWRNSVAGAAGHDAHVPARSSSASCRLRFRIQVLSMLGGGLKQIQRQNCYIEPVQS